MCSYFPMGHPALATALPPRHRAYSLCRSSAVTLSGPYGLAPSLAFQVITVDGAAEPSTLPASQVGVAAVRCRKECASLRSIYGPRVC